MSATGRKDSRAELVISDAAAEVILTIGSRDDLGKVRRRLVALATFPEIGVAYDPVYEAARFDHDVLVTYAEHYGIYYIYDAESGRVAVEHVCDERRDPTRRFEG